MFQDSANTTWISTVPTTYSGPAPTHQGSVASSSTSAVPSACQTGRGTRGRCRLPPLPASWWPASWLPTAGNRPLGLHSRKIASTTYTARPGTCGSSTVFRLCTSPSTSEPMKAPRMLPSPPMMTAKKAYMR